MIYVLGTGLPLLAEPKLRNFCAVCENSLTGRLAKKQLEHIRSYKLRGAPLLARLSGVLARMLAFSRLPPDAVIDMDFLWRPIIRRSTGFDIAFSHARHASFCAVNAHGASTAQPVAVDAELAAEKSRVDSMRHFLQKLGAPQTALLPDREVLFIWLLMESAVKIYGEYGRCITAKLGRVSRRGSIFFAGAYFSWHILPFLGHWLCIGYQGSELPPVSCFWINPQRLLSMNKNA